MIDFFVIASSDNVQPMEDYNNRPSKEPSIGPYIDIH